MESAVAIAESAFREIQPSITIGMRERELATALVQALHSAGSEPALPFIPIVATGPNGADPHHFPGDRRLALGDLQEIMVIIRGTGWFSPVEKATLDLIHRNYRFTSAAEKLYHTELSNWPKN